MPLFNVVIYVACRWVRPSLRLDWSFIPVFAPECRYFRSVEEMSRYANNLFTYDAISFHQYCVNIIRSFVGITNTYFRVLILTESP